MANGQNTKLYVEKSLELTSHKSCENGLEFFVNIIFLNEKLIDIQQEIIKDFMANFIDRAGHQEALTTEEVAIILEEELEMLNTRLDAFVEKIENIEEVFAIKGSIKVVYRNTLFSSLIGDVSMLIARNNKTYYAANNDVQPANRIDTFSDFIEGEVQKDDKIVILGTNYDNILEKQDMKELDEVRDFDAKDIINFFEKLFTSKVDPTELCFILVQNFNQKNVFTPSKLQKKDKKPLITKKFLIKHKYNITIGVLALFIVFLLFNVIGSLKGGISDAPNYIMDDGTEVKITIEGIKKDINDFANYPAEDENKAKVYKRITEQLGILESENRWPDEVKKRKQYVQEKYYEGFNVVLIDSIDKSSNYFSFVYPFSSEQNSLLGEPLNVMFNQSLYIAGTNGALMQAISQDIKGNPISYNDDSIEIQGCNFDLSKQGMYCFDDNSSIYRITAGGVQPIVTEDGFFPGKIHDIGTFTSSNIYILHDDQSFDADSKKVISRYSNKLGSYTEFGNSTQYVNRFLGGSGSTLDLNSMSIDGSFLVWDGKDRKLHQLWREPESIVELSSREVPLLGGDVIENGLGADVKVIQLADSPYVYMFDKEKQTLTVYSSNPKKTSAGKQNNYSLLYLFRLQFDKSKDKIVDVTIPETNNNYMYILTEKGVYETNLETFINQFEA